MDKFVRVFFGDEPTTDGPTRIGQMIGNVLGPGLYRSDHLFACSQTLRQAPLDCEEILSG